MASAVEEVAALDRVLTRVALTDEENLEKVLQRLVPAVISQLKSPHDATRKKVLELLSHVNKRVQGQKSMKLPLEPLLDLFRDPASAAMTQNFALVYVEMAFKRADPTERFAVVDKLLTGISKRTSQQQDMLLRLAVGGLQHLAEMPHGLQYGEEFCAKYQFLSREDDRKVFLDFALKVLLFQPVSGRQGAGTPLSAGVARMEQAGRVSEEAAVHTFTASRARGANPFQSMLQGAGGGGPEDAAEAAQPAGLSPHQVTQIVGKEPISAEVLARRKCGILNFTKAAQLEVGQTLLHYLAAAADPNDAVARLGEDLLKKRCGLDSAKPAVDLESPALMSRLFALFHGTPPSSSLEPPNRVAPASRTLQARLMALFCKSIAAANCAPYSYQAIYECLYGRGTTGRLKQAGMEFAVWVFKHGASSQLEEAGPDILQALLALLEDEQRGAAGSSQASLLLRGFTYQAIGQLGERAPSLVRGDVGVARQLFHALAVEPPGVRASLQEALSALSHAFKGISGEGLEEIRELLLDGITTQTSSGVRFCAVQWATRLFPFCDATARYICMLAAADKKIEVREAGLNGLKQELFKAEAAGEQADAAEKQAFPSSSDVVSYVQARHPRMTAPAKSTEQLLLEPKAFLALIRFVSSCRQHSAFSASDTQHFQDVLEHALVREGTSELHVAALLALLDTAALDVEAFATRYSQRAEWLRTFIVHTDAEARGVAGKLLGIVVTCMEAGQVQQLLVQLCTSFPAEHEGTSHKFEERSGSLTAAGYVLAQCATGVPKVPELAQVTAQKGICSALGDPTPGLGAAAALALGHAGLRTPLRLPQGQPQSESAKAADVPAGKSDGPGDVVMGEADESKPAKDVESRLDAVAAIASICKDKDLKSASKAAIALGYLAAGDRSAALLEAIASALLGLSSKKGDELQFAVGEALCFAYGGHVVAEDTILRTSFRSLAVELTSTDMSGGPPGSGSGVQPMEVDPAAEQGDKVPDAALHAFQERILASICDDYIFHSRTEVRSAACIWLVSIVSFTRKTPALLHRLDEIQEAFSHLLGDSNELIQEMASRGISAVYRLGSDSDRKGLLAGLMATLQGGARKRRAVKVSGETKVFEEGQIGEAPGGGSLSTYKELCSLATEMGQPDLLYKFMDLANHAAALNSSRGAAFGFASIAKMAGEQMAPFVAQLVPRLYRYQYDPNPRIRDGMTNIWTVLVREPRKAVDEHFQTILSELLREMGAKLWRNREAACLALADLLQGRRWADVQDRLEEMWRMAFRALDDIKESVRTAATGLIRTLRGLTLRLADPEHSPRDQAAAAVAITLPFLVESGTSSTVPEIQALALTTISRMVQLAGAAQIRPHLPQLVATMLESLSGMEDARINYVEQHVEALGIDSSRLESARVSASNASPMADTLDLCVRYTDDATLEALVPRLLQLIKSGLGITTRVGTAKYITSLTLRLGSDMKPHAGSIIKALIGAARNENSAAVKRAFASTAAQVAKFAAEARAAQLASDAVRLYTDPGDKPSRHLAGLVCRELARQAPDAFAGQATQIMPLAFIASSDEDPDVAALWKDVWSESSSSQSAAARLYMSEILALLLEGLSSQQWERKKAAAKSVKRLCEEGGDSLAPSAATICAALLQELPGRIWDGKECLLEALAALCKAAPTQLDSRRIVDALVAAMERPKSSYRNAALLSLGLALSHLQGSFYDVVAPPLLKAVDTAQRIDRKKAEEGEEVAKPLPLVDSLKALAAAWKGVEPADRRLHQATYSAHLAMALNPAHTWAVRAAALSACKALFAGMTTAPAKGEDSQGGVTGLLPGILEALEEQRISQVRALALDCLSQILGQGLSLTYQQVQQIEGQLQTMLRNEKNAELQSRAMSTRELLPSQRI